MADIITEGYDAWYTHHDELVRLVGYMADTGATAREVAAAVEKPWKYEDEYRAALQADADNEAEEARLFGTGI